MTESAPHVVDSDSIQEYRGIDSGYGVVNVEEIPDGRGVSGDDFSVMESLSNHFRYEKGRVVRFLSGAIQVGKSEYDGRDVEFFRKEPNVFFGYPLGEAVIAIIRPKRRSFGNGRRIRIVV